jgi:GNAT superfamily N-acetyltransferase
MKIQECTKLIRKATSDDIDAVELIYRHIHEQEQTGKVTIGWNPNIYPVRNTAEQALQRGDLYVYELSGEVVASAIINGQQVPAYTQGQWLYEAADDEVLVLHTLVVEPSAGGKGIGKAFVHYYEQLAKRLGCKALRLDTNSRNVIARNMYPSLGYREVGVVPCVFNGIPDVQLVLFEKLV